MEVKYWFRISTSLSEGASAAIITCNSFTGDAVDIFQQQLSYHHRLLDFIKLPLDSSNSSLKTSFNANIYSLEMDDDPAMPTPPLSGGRTPIKPYAEELPLGHRRTRTHTCIYTPVVSSPNPPRLANAQRPTPSPTRRSLSSSTPASRSSSSSSPQQEPGSAQYLDRLLRLVRCRRALRSSSSSAMADFLASFNLGAQTPTASSNPQCDSVQDLQLHLRGALDAKVTPNRAEHLSITLELRATVRFQLAVPEPENGVLESLSNIDPLMGGVHSASVTADEAGGQHSRVVFANDTLMNQPQDDPALQRSVAKHIIGLVSSTDGSTWTVREVSRGSQGWTFTYLCKDSFQQWNRQTSKNPTKALVGEFSQRDPDPVLYGKFRMSHQWLSSIVDSSNQPDLPLTAVDASLLHSTATAAQSRSNTITPPCTRRLLSWPSTSSLLLAN